MAGVAPSPETRLLNLLERQEALAAEQEALKRDIELAQEVVEEKWLNEGVTSMKTNRGTLYRRGQRLARFTAKGEGLVELLEQEGLGHLVTKSTYANDRSLLGWLNKEAEQDELGNPIIPDALKPHVWTDVKYDIRLRRS